VELFRLAQTGTLRVFVHLPQYLTPGAVPGTVATVVLGDGTGKRLPARLVRASGAVDPASRTLLVELELPNQDRSVLPGGFAQVEFPDSGASIGWTVPANTLLFRPEGLVVAVVDSQNTVEMRRVILGRDFGATVEVSSGVDASTRLVLNPSDSLSSGAKIRQATGFSGAGK
jgi:multidrug efflux pump subunit AcrA (membrane-fusion protein)